MKLLARVATLVLVAGLVIVLTITTMARTQLGGGAVIQGIVRFKQGPVPGAVVTAVNASGSKRSRAITEVNGQFILKVGDVGSYHVTVDITGFSSETGDIEVADASKPVQKDFQLSLLSQAQRANAQQAAPAATTAQAGREGRIGGGRGNVQQETPGDQAEENPFAELQTNPSIALLPGMTPDAATESVAIAGNTAAPQFGGAFDPRQFDFGNVPGNFDQANSPEAFGAPAPNGNNGVGNAGGRGGTRGANDFAAAFGGGGAGGGGRGGGRGGRGGGNFNLGGQRGRNANPINVNLSYTLSDSALDAAPYHLTGQAASPKPEYLRNNFSATVGGPFGIPRVLNSQRNTFNLTYNGARSTNPTDSYYTVPTLAERQGDLSQALVRGNPVTIYDPITKTPFENNAIPADRIDPAAKGLLSYIPLPNNPTADGTRNYHYVTSMASDSDSINFNIQHTFAQPNQRGQRGQRGGGAGGGRGGGGRGGRGGTLSVQFQFQRQNNVQTGTFPSIGGSGLQHAFNTQVSYGKPVGRLQNQLQVRINRNHNQNTNLYAGITNVAGLVGITGVSTDPADWGLPSLSFVNFNGLNDRTPSNVDNWTFHASDTWRWNRRNHNISFGADVTRTINDVHSTTGNPRGQFTFNGQATGVFSSAGLIDGAGFDFADFLLGLPQQTTLAYGANGHKFLSIQYNGFMQDDWRLRGNLTLNYGLRYEYASPYTEASNHLVNLDVANGFTALAPVQPGQSGPFSGTFPKTLVNPDRNNFAPRIGLAWRGAGRFVVRTGYGITYNAGAYSAMANQFVRQPPFALTAKNCVQYGPLIGGASTTCVQPGASALTLERGFPALSPTVIQNTFGVDVNYRVGYAQQWNFDVQRDLPGNIQMSLDYSGVKGTRLDVAEAPNRTSLGTARIPNVISYVWETSQGNSIYHGAVLQLRRRLSRGIQIGGTYTFSKMIDDASSFTGGSGSGVVQDALNLRAERAVDNGDQRHVFAGTYTLELPFGQNKPFLHGDDLASRLIGDWLVNGSVNYGSGRPFTPRITNSSCDYSATNTTLRPDFLGGPIRLDHPTVGKWFDTDVFRAPEGCLGNAGRNIIRGPGTASVNMTLNKSFRLERNRTLDVRIQANNVFNMVTYSGLNTTVNSNLFGQITSAGAMRRITIQARFRF